uniref:Uncharacterized protein n=1 Tax=Arundo donax TaxID=35708 RepID=A0A0A8XW38_ARUDO
MKRTTRSLPNQNQKQSADRSGHWGSGGTTFPFPHQQQIP